VQAAWEALDEADLGTFRRGASACDTWPSPVWTGIGPPVLVVLDAAKRAGDAERSLLERLRTATAPCWLVLNKADLVGGPASARVADAAAAYTAQLPFARTVALSAAKGDGLAALQVHMQGPRACAKGMDR
jgi:tRNA U34 5-carboxymethylaminomethyl modifying GTPase MnmE/TrmE